MWACLRFEMSFGEMKIQNMAPNGRNKDLRKSEGQEEGGECDVHKLKTQWQMCFKIPIWCSRRQSDWGIGSALPGLVVCGDLELGGGAATAGEKSGDLEIMCLGNR